eukprot:TRINITY_DN5619_c0_g1_i1.p1 TRINITY_DN5619_c0_g1~~TRINITY_DN5619_c0_g1_i1.p1  ORF type:complete len:541 (-),score=168.88 TRINITY_DN5619_c0_g1_i1:56-1627(-)
MTIFKSPLPDVVIPENVTLAQFVLEDFLKYGDKTALVDAVSGRELSYKQVYHFVHKLAAGFQRAGVKRGDVIAILSPNIIEYPVIIFALQKFGAIPTTMNPTYTPEEIYHQLQDSNALRIITLPLFLNQVVEARKLLGRNIEIITLGEAQETTPFSSLVSGDLSVDYNYPVFDSRKATAVIPYSSGTTGKPKGVILTHYNIISNILQTVAVEGGFTPDQKLVGFLPFFHIYGMVVLLNVGLRYGCAIAVISKFDLKVFLNAVQKYKLTNLHIAPPVALMLVKDPLVQQYDLSSVRTIVSAAAPLGGDIQDSLASKLKVVVKQGCGMTELSPTSHYEHAKRIQKGSIGMLVPNCIAKLVDPVSKEAVGVGKEGEFWIKGPNVMAGYLNNPKATAETIDQDGFLHSGDIMTVDEGGYYYVVDRLKELIKYNGLQVAPAELEAVIITHPAVADVAVVGKPDVQHGELPTAFVVVKQGFSVTSDEISTHVANKLAPHKRLRGGVIFVDAIPKSAAGKILRRTLRAKL